MSIVSIFKSIKDVNNPFNKDVLYCLKRIKDGNSKDFVEQLRLMSPEDYSKNKTKLPVVCFCGKFKHRSATGLIQHSNYIVLDFDKFQSKEEATTFKDSICSDDHIFSAWISPSALGVKLLVKIPGNPKDHKGYFQSLKKHFNHPNWDDSGSDVARTCFESYDPEIYINHDSAIWTELEHPEIEEVGTFEPVVRLTSSNQIVEKLLVWWTSKYGMNKGSKNNNLHKLASAFNDFGISQQDALSECMKYDEGGKEKEIEKLVISAYKRPSAGKAFEDVHSKEKIEKLIRSGKTAKEVQKVFKDVDISRIKENLDIEEFWFYTDKGKVSLSIHKFKFWLEQNNFFKYYPSANSNTFTFIKKEQNLLEETNEKRIKDYVLKDILDRDNIGYGPYDYMASNSAYFKSDFLSMLDTTEIEIKEDTSTECYLYFRNCVVKITADGIEKIDYLDLEGYVWRRQIIDRDYEKFDHHESEFRTYLWLASGKNVQKYNSLKSVIGYLLHSFKTSANNKAIIFNDETISENPNGGSGKGIFWNGLKNMKKVSRIDGKMFEPTKSFPYQTVSTDTQILVFDDVKKNFNFENLFSLITEGITLEYKGQDAIIIPVERSPKILITTNYTVGGIGGSFERRKFEVEMSSYFSHKHTPLDEFGHMLYSDWDKKEWLRFDNFMINCEQYYLKNGLVKHNFNNLEVRKFIKETSYEFYEWSEDRDNLPHNFRIDKTEYFTKFCNEYQDFKKFLSQRKFTQWLESYGKYYNLKYVSGRTNSTRWIDFEDPTQPMDNDNKIPF